MTGEQPPRKPVAQGQSRGVGDPVGRLHARLLRRDRGVAGPAAAAGAFRYEQVIQLVKRLIADGGLNRGDRLPTNNELAEMAGVSLISVRRALSELEHEGRVRRHQGLGTFVAADPIVTEPLRVGELRATLVGRGAPTEVSTELVGIREALPGGLIARALRISHEDPVWHVERRRLIRGGSPIFEEAVVPVALAPDLDVDALRAGTSLYLLLAEGHGLVDAREEQFLSFGPATAAERRMLELPARAYVARLRGVSLTVAGVPFDCFQHVYSATDFLFWISSDQVYGTLEAVSDGAWSLRPIQSGPE